jgi:hypothetical protein
LDDSPKFNSGPPCQPSKQKLFHFLVRRLLAARIAKLLRFQTLRVLLFVLRRGVVAVLAFAALQCNGLAHFLPSLLSTRRFDLITQVQQSAHYRFRKGPNLRFFPAVARMVITAPSAGPSAKPLFGTRQRFLNFDPPNKIALRIRAHFLWAADGKPEKLMPFPNLQAFSV